jgi:hypothetical protein
VRRRRHHLQTSILLFVLLCLGPLAVGQMTPPLAPTARNVDAVAPGGTSPTIIIGFVGGFVRSDNSVHSPVQLAARLRHTYASGVYVQVFENRQGEQAHQEIVKLVDTNHDGKLSAEEKRSARIIIYGMSWGGSETVQLARELDAEKIPVLLTIQVDSITKWRQDDQLIPANVAQAVNFYQPNGLLHGASQIRAADPSRTRILGNFRFTYDSLPTTCQNYPWWDRIFVKQHTSIECDPTVWNQVESLIRSKLATVGLHAASQD